MINQGDTQMTKHFRNALLTGFGLLFAMHPAAFASQATIACSDVIVSNDSITIYMKGKGRKVAPLHFRAASPEILATLKRASVDGKSKKADCKVVINYEGGVINGVAK